MVHQNLHDELEPSTTFYNNEAQSLQVCLRCNARFVLDVSQYTEQNSRSFRNVRSRRPLPQQPATIMNLICDQHVSDRLQDISLNSLM